MTCHAGKGERMKVTVSPFLIDFMCSWCTREW
jgi:hypothetical protein